MIWSIGFLSDPEIGHPWFNLDLNNRPESGLLLQHLADKERLRIHLQLENICEDLRFLCNAFISGLQSYEGHRSKRMVESDPWRRILCLSVHLLRVNLADT